MITLSDYLKKEYGEKLYKISLNGGMTCPNRDGTLGLRGCIFCSEGGSGDFASDPSETIDEQIENAKKLVSGKYRGKRYIAYFQAYTNTYAPVGHLEKLYRAVTDREDIAILDIATRPDCLGPEVLKLIGDLNRCKPVWVELGLQTVRPSSVDYIRRGYDTAVYDEAVKQLNALGIHTVTHVILGLPYETEEDMLETVRHAVEAGTKGIKLQLLHVLAGTDLADDYAAGKFRTLEEDEYMSILKRCLELLPDDTVVHRLTGDGPKKLLIAPLWSGNKKEVMNRIRNEVLNVI